jgi:hypothetical protein
MLKPERFERWSDLKSSNFGNIKIEIIEILKLVQIWKK